MDIIIEKIIQKRSQINNMNAGPNKEEFIRKLNLIEDMLVDEECFLKLKMETVFSILEFLEISEEEIMNIYFELIDPKKKKTLQEKL